jgi:hypothetical protein
MGIFGCGGGVGDGNSCSHKSLVNAAATNPLPAKPPNLNICLLVLLFGTRILELDGIGIFRCGVDIGLGIGGGDVFVGL